MDEIMSMSEDGKVSMTCEFCEVDFDFSEQELRSVLEKAASE
jgi:redox-regulated HSP33 family molecular chaperone